jgi:hypothetical protein
MIDLKFKTKSQEMIFCDQSTGQLANAWNLQPATHYDVFIVIENFGDHEAPNVQLNITHGPVGIGFTDQVDLITLDPVGVLVPPGSQATYKFVYQTEPLGYHTCLCAKIVPNINPSIVYSPATYNQCISQNTTVVGIPVGGGATSFLVYGLASPSINLSVTETGAGASWHPKISAPALIPSIGNTTPTSAPFHLNNLTPNHDPYVMSLHVNPIAGASDHTFHIEGKDLAGNSVGSVDIKIQGKPAEMWVAPAPFIYGGYHSQDIRLLDINTNQEKFVGEELDAGTPYNLSVRVYNSSTTPAENTVVKFWSIPGGIASDGIQLLYSKIVTVPGINNGGFIEVPSDTPFTSATIAEHHRCAGVSIYNSLSPLCATDANTAAETQMLINNTSYIPSCAAWRNTNSKTAKAGSKIKTPIELGIYHKDFGPGPVEIVVQHNHIPIDWYKNTKVIEIMNMHKSAGITPNLPIYLWPALKETLKMIDLKTRISMKPKSQVEGKYKNGIFIINPKEGIKASFIISMEIPKSLKSGDIILMKVIANYAKSGKLPVRSVEFLEILHVTGN